jgi:hypothetical protein
MLNVPAVLRCAVGAPNLRSIILEMTVKRDETAPVDAVIHQEQAAVVESRDYLVQELPKVTSFRCSLWPKTSVLLVWTGRLQGTLMLTILPTKSGSLAAV